jgi:hypothetical protein
MGHTVLILTAFYTNDGELVLGYWVIVLEVSLAEGSARGLSWF